MAGGRSSCDATRGNREGYAPPEVNLGTSWGWHQLDPIRPVQGQGCSGAYLLPHKSASLLHATPWPYVLASSPCASQKRERRDQKLDVRIYDVVFWPVIEEHPGIEVRRFEDNRRPNWPS